MDKIDDEGGIGARHELISSCVGLIQSKRPELVESLIFASPGPMKE